MRPTESPWKDYATVWHSEYETLRIIPAGMDARLTLSDLDVRSYLYTRHETRALSLDNDFQPVALQGNWTIKERALGRPQIPNFPTVHRYSLAVPDFAYKVEPPFFRDHAKHWQAGEHFAARV